MFLIVRFPNLILWDLSYFSISHHVIHINSSCSRLLRILKRILVKRYISITLMRWRKVVHFPYFLKILKGFSFYLHLVMRHKSKISWKTRRSIAQVSCSRNQKPAWMKFWRRMWWLPFLNINIAKYVNNNSKIIKSM